MKRLLVGLVTSVTLLGCNSEALTVVKLDPGAECAKGGVKILVPGQDPQIVCNGTDGTATNGTNGTDGTNGTSGFTTLLTQTQLPAGDARCPRGGVEVQAGLDSGGDGGVPNDGVLQGGEVTSSSVVCTGDDGARVGSMVPPGGAAGTSVIRANGGTATHSGMNGGTVAIGMANGTNGGHVKVWKTGHADASFTVPTPNAGELGALPLNITTNTTLPYSLDGAMVAPGSPYVNETGLYFAGGGLAPARPITGLTVAAGATLTLPTLPYLSQWLAMGTCRVDGTLAWTPGQQGSTFGLSCAELVLSATSRVDGRAQMGRTVATELLASRARLLALGSIELSGDVAPAGGGSLLLSGVELFTGGTIVSNGAPGMAGGSVQLNAVMLLANGASIEAKGGARQGGGFGGTGGTVTLTLTNHFGALKNRGAIDVSGGPALNCSECNSGSGGTISLNSLAPALINDAALTAKGGDCSDFAAGGGTVRLSLGVPFHYVVGGEGSMMVSGTIDASGGEGSTSGGGGLVELIVNGGVADGTELVLLGYATVEANGGTGTSGGAAGVVRLFQSAQAQAFNTPAAPGGAVLVTADLSAKGGEGTTSFGGNGGTIDLSTQTDLHKAGADWEQVRSFGTLSVNGGQGTSGGSGGSVFMLGLSGVRVEGTVEGRGALGTNGSGGNGGSLDLISLHSRVDNTAAWNASAGDSGGAIVVSGNGGNISLAGRQVTTSGTLRARGGASSLMGGVGGLGGLVFLTSEPGFVTQNTAAAPAGIDVSGGTATTAGVAGRVVIDRELVTAQWTH